MGKPHDVFHGIVCEMDGVENRVMELKDDLCALPHLSDGIHD